MSQSFQKNWFVQYPAKCYATYNQYETHIPEKNANKILQGEVAIVSFKLF